MKEVKPEPVKPEMAKSAVKQPESMTAEENSRPLKKNNFVMMIIAGVMIVLGFVLMTGSASGPDGYNPDIFSTRRIVVGPMISFLGFVFMAVAIIIKPKNSLK